MTKTVLVVAAHSDDEALGCAGTIAKHTAVGDQVHVLFMTDGVGSRNISGDEVLQRNRSAQKSGKLLGISSMRSLDFPDNKMDAVPLLDVTQAVEQMVFESKPDVIYTHHIGDLNVDHCVTHKAVMTACRPQPSFCVKEIYSFEVLSSTEWQTPGFYPFLPNVFVDITNYIEIKKKVLEVYSEEMRHLPHSRSIENALRLCELRGNGVGKRYAEAFMSVREIR